MRTLLAALTALMLLATPVVGGDFEDALVAAKAGDYQKAFRLWKPLAEQGSSWALYQLGVMYAKGQGVKQSDVKAYAWWATTAEDGNSRAAKAKTTLGK